MKAPVYDRWGIRVYEGDCLDVLREMEPDSVHSIVTDPPAGIRFMGRAWDSDMGGRHSWVAWLSERMTEAYRVLKPGAHALVWALPRTSHWTAWALEDAGFEVRDCIVHAFGSGFPKSHDVSMAIDRVAGADREVIGRRDRYRDGHARQNLGDRNEVYGQGLTANGVDAVTAPAADAARQWDGWGTALKPAAEHWWLVRKPLGGTVAANVLEHGTGALNIATCRVATGEPIAAHHGTGNARTAMRNGWHDAYRPGDAGMFTQTAGRWPSNLVLTHAAILDPTTGEPIGDSCADGCVDGCPVAELDAQSGDKRGFSSQTDSADYMSDGTTTYGAGIRSRAGFRAGFNDSGGASRFFPQFRWEAKAPASERPRINGKAHPTVKPIALMRWLVRLVTAPGGTVLDLFAGTGTTGQAARAEGLQAVLIEQDPDSIAYIVARLDGLPKTELAGEASAAALSESDPIDLFGFLNEEAS